MPTILEKLNIYIEDPANDQRIDSYNTLLHTAQIKENQDVDIDKMLKLVSKLTPTIVDEAGDVMIDFCHYIENAMEAYIKTNFKTNRKQFNDINYDLIYYITWLGVDEVVKSVANPQLIFNRLNKGEFQCIMRSISWKEDVEEFFVDDDSEKVS